MKYGKTLFAVAVALMMLAVPLTVMMPAMSGDNASGSSNAYDPADYIVYEYNDSKTTAIITGYSGTNTMPFDLVIPSKVKNPSTGVECNVTEIGKKWTCAPFAGLNVKSVTIPSSVVTIWSGAFQGCKQLEKVTFSEGLQEIHWNVFDGCSSLKSIEFPDSLKYLGGYAFAGTALKTVTLPAGLLDPRTGEGRQYENPMVAPFCNCELLEEIKMGDGEKAAYDVKDGILYTKDFKEIIQCPTKVQLGDYTVGSTVEKIWKNSFSGNQTLTKLTLTTTVKEVQELAFGNCYSLTYIDAAGNKDYKTGTAGELILISKNLLVTYPAGNPATSYTSDVTALSIDAFGACKNLKSISLPKVTEIPKDEYNPCTVFDRCTSLEEVHLGTVKAFPEGVFKNLENLKTVTVTGLETIGKSAFEGCLSLTQFTIPETVTEIGQYAFKGCTGLIGKISLPDNLKEISSSVFEGCTGLSEVVIPDKLTTIADSAFKGCSSLTKINLKKITTVGMYSFMGCSSLSSVDFTSMEYIKDCAFKDCKALDGIKFFAESVVINECAFEGCTSLKDLNLDSVIQIGDNAFRGCNALETVNIASSVKNIRNSPFNGCQNLTEITVAGMNFNFVSENGVLYSVDNNQKKNTLIQYPCGKAGTSFTIPDDVKTVGKEAIVGTKLTSLTIGKDVLTIEANGISGNKLLTEIIVAEGNKEFKTVDGALCDSKNNLILYPSGRTDKEINLSTCNRIEPGALSGCTSAEKITIRHSVVFEGNPFTDCTSLKEIVVSDPENTGYYSDGGMLYKRDVKGEVGKVVICPIGIEVFKPKDGTSTICNDALKGCVFKSIELPKTVTNIEANAFSGMAFYKNDKTTLITDYSLLLGKKYLLLESDDGVLKYYEAGPDVTDVVPQEGYVSRADTITVSGRTVDGSKVTISVNGGTPEEATVTGGLFSKDVKLTEGSNTIVIVAEKDGLETEITRHVYYNPTPSELTVSITSPTDKSTVSDSTLEVKGTATNAVKVTIMVNGTAVGDVTPTGNAFSKTVTLSEGKNTIVAIATGADGKTVSSSTVTVTYEVSPGPTPPTPTPTPSSDDGMTIALCVVFFFVVLGVICIAAYPGKK